MPVRFSKGCGAASRARLECGSFWSVPGQARPSRRGVRARVLPIQPGPAEDIPAGCSRNQQPPRPPEKRAKAAADLDIDSNAVATGAVSQPATALQVRGASSGHPPRRTSSAAGGGRCPRYTMLAIMTPLPTEGLGGRTWSQDGLVGLELEAEPTEACAPVAAPLWEACMPTPEQEGSPPRSRARSVRFAVDENTPQPLFSSDSPRPVRRLTSAERLDLTQQRPDLDVRGLPWARRMRRRAACRRRTRPRTSPRPSSAGPGACSGARAAGRRRRLPGGGFDAVSTDAVAAEEVVIERRRTDGADDVAASGRQPQRRRRGCVRGPPEVADRQDIPTV